MSANYLITGLPRTRSAWLAALLGSLEVPCYHDTLTTFGGLGEFATAADDPKHEFGLSCPGAACVFPDFAAHVFRDKPIVFIARDPDDAFNSASKFLGSPFPEWKTVMRNSADFLAITTSRPMGIMAVEFQQLEDFNVVSKIHEYCTGKPLPKSRFNVFNDLSVEQNLYKVVRRLHG